MVSEYRVTLLNGDYAVLQLRADKGWDVAIVDGRSQKSTPRGLFGTARDALMVLSAEIGAQPE